MGEQAGHLAPRTQHLPCNICGSGREKGREAVIVFVAPGWRQHMAQGQQPAETGFFWHGEGIILKIAIQHTCQWYKKAGDISPTQQ